MSRFFNLLSILLLVSFLSITECLTSSIDTIKERILKEHNTYRKKHGAPDLTWDKDIESIAQSWADKLAKQGSISHSTNTYQGSKLGENCFSCGGNNCLDSYDPVDDWYSEVSSHNFNSPENSAAGHFTQVVWKKTKKLGCGIGTTSGAMPQYFVVCNYFPSGNSNGEYSANVLPAGSAVEDVEGGDSDSDNSTCPSRTGLAVTVVIETLIIVSAGTLIALYYLEILKFNIPFLKKRSE